MRNYFGTEDVYQNQRVIFICAFHPVLSFLEKQSLKLCQSKKWTYLVVVNYKTIGAYFCENNPVNCFRIKIISVLPF